MKEVFNNALNELNNNEEFVVASVVRTSGSTPQKPGSKLLVKKDGTTIGTLGGGCVEGDIWFASKEILSNGGSAKYQDYVLNEDLAANDGLVCGGTMYFLIDPYRKEKSDLNNQLLSEMDKAYKGELSLVLATIINSKNEEMIGQKLILKDNGDLMGDISGESLIKSISKEAPELMNFGTCKTIENEEVQIFLEGIILRI